MAFEACVNGQESSHDSGSHTTGFAMQCCTCKKEFDPATSTALPFCSERCRTIDLGRWLDEAYGLPERQPLDDESPETFAGEGEENWEV